MKKFKFIRGLDLTESPLFNGVADAYLIELSENIWQLSSWIESVLLTIDPELNQDSIMFCFNDIDRCKYLCTIYQDFSFELLQVIEDEFEDEELIDSINIPLHTRQDHTRVLDYLRNMPRSIIDSI